jgi:hypothetical protein
MIQLVTSHVRDSAAHSRMGKSRAEEKSKAKTRGVTDAGGVFALFAERVLQAVKLPALRGPSGRASRSSCFL